MCEAYGINHITSGGHHRVVADGIGDTTIHHHTVLIPSVGTIVGFFTIDSDLESNMTAIANGVVGVYSGNIKLRLVDYFHRINTESFAAETNLLNQNTIGLIVTCSSCRHMSASLGSGTSYGRGSVGIAEPFVEDTRSELVADVGCKGHIRTFTNRILIMGDLHIDGVIDIHIVRLTCCGATEVFVRHHKSERVGIGARGKHGVNRVGTRLECGVGFSPLVFIAIEIIVDVSGQLDSVVQTDHRGTGDFNGRHRTDNSSIEHNRVGSTAADALGHRDGIDIIGLRVVRAGERFSEHGIRHT